VGFDAQSSSAVEEQSTANPFNTSKTANLNHHKSTFIDLEEVTPEMD